MSDRVVTYGEIMLRLNPPGFKLFFSIPCVQSHLRRRRDDVAVFITKIGLN